MKIKVCAVCKKKIDWWGRATGPVINPDNYEIGTLTHGLCKNCLTIQQAELRQQMKGKKK